ncbi:hypothetical protein M432DRAFT_601777 [Thermoascus aurantiacus ATCC 26904]
MSCISLYTPYLLMLYPASLQPPEIDLLMSSCLASGRFMQLGWAHRRRRPVLLHQLTVSVHAGAQTGHVSLPRRESPWRG